MSPEEDVRRNLQTDLDGLAAWLEPQGEKRFGDQLVRMRIDIDSLEGAIGTYYEGKSGIVKLRFLQVDR